MDYDIRVNHAEEALLFMDANAFAPCDTRQAQSASDNGGMAGCATASGQDTLRDKHAVDIVGTGLWTHQHDRRSCFAQLLCAVGIEDRLAGGRARGSIQPFREVPSCFRGTL